MGYNKFGNKTKVVDGINFQSIREAERYKQLKIAEKCGAIKNLEMQKKFVLLPAQYIDKKCVEKSVSYYADFYYYDTYLNEYVCEDVKGVKTKEYILKRKMMLYFYKIRIVEV